MNGDAVRLYRQTNGLTLEGLARELGVSTSTVWRIENGETKRLSPVVEREFKRLVAKSLVGGDND